MMMMRTPFRRQIEVRLFTAGAINIAPAALFLASCAACCDAQVVAEFGPVADTTIYESTPALPLANGGGTHLFIGNNSLDATRRTMLRFDVSAIPAGSVVQSVQLRMDVNQDANATPLPANVMAVTRSWCEGTTVASGAQGGGGAAQSGDATWHAACLGSANWSLRGGDFEETVLSSLLMAGIATYTWPTSPDFVRVVQTWVDTPASNFGLMVQGDESAMSTAKRMLSRESMDVGKRPALIVVYQPAAVCDGIDFNRNDVFPEDQDVIDFFNVLAGADCPYTPGASEVCDIDFNNNGVFPEDQDVIDFFAVLAGGECS